jgi:hypothetical protein
MKRFFYFKTTLRVAGLPQMKLNWIVILFTALFFFAVGFLILYDNYTRIEVWFQLSDLHHETFAMSSFALAIGILIGAIIVSIKKQRRQLELF